MSAIHASYTFPWPVADEVTSASLLAHVKGEVRRRFGEALISALEGRGGIVGPIHERESRVPNGVEEYGRYEMYAHLTDLPEPEAYRLLGGPADGHVVRTGGVPLWRVPVLPPMPVASPYDFDFDATALTPVYAEYERQGDTPVYIYRRNAK